MSFRILYSRPSRSGPRDGRWRQFAAPLAIVSSVWFALESSARMAAELWGDHSAATHFGFEPFVWLAVALVAAALIPRKRRLHPQKPRPGSRHTIASAQGSSRAAVTSIPRRRLSDSETPNGIPTSQNGTRRSA